MEVSGRNNNLTRIGVNNLLKLTSCGPNSENIANIILGGDFYHSSGLDVFHLGDSINWNYKHRNSANTYQLYLHSLNLISYLCNGYEVSKNKKYLTKAKDILVQWIAFNNSKRKKSNYVWCDHSVSSRAINIIYFYNLSAGVIEFEELNIPHLLENHANFLEKDSNYRKNNHGIMSDRALAALAVSMKKNPRSKSWIKKSIRRLKEAYSRDFSNKGVHLENSPDYHRIVHGKLFLQTEDFLNKHGYSLGKDIKNKIKLGTEYYKYILKPDLSLPLIGDTSLGTMKKIDKVFDSFCDKEAGIGILQWKSNENIFDSTWISFICGYGNKTHKHLDDLSFTLYYKSDDIFVDSGKYNYDRKDPIRKYMLSPLAHNTLTIEGDSYKIETDRADHRKIGIANFTSNDKYDFIKGINYSYENSRLERSLLFIKPSLLIILDKFEGANEKKYLQNFNLSPQVKIIDHNGNKITLKSKNSQIQIEQLAGFQKLSKYYGEKEKNRAIISEKFSRIINTKQLEFSKQSKKGIFLTVIRMGDKTVSERKEKIQFNENTNILTVANEALNIKIKV